MKPHQSNDSQEEQRRLPWYLNESEKPDNLSLAYDKFTYWNMGGQNPNKCKDALGKFVDHASGDLIVKTMSVVKDQYLKNFFVYQQSLEKQGYFVKCFELELAAPLVIGLGIQHVLEIGFMFHRSYGIPYIPGSSLKGLTKSYLSAVNKENLNQIFGQEKKEGDSGFSGNVVFWDSFPTNWFSKNFLEEDIMTPHFGDYYTQQKLPTTNMAVIPISFLRIKQGTCWNFRVSSRLPGQEYQSLVEQAKGYLEEALKETGLGAKTALGYGWFKDPSSNPSTLAPNKNRRI
jgi:CRISPR type III-B/RAMP module RAMP protein Cmr6